MNMNHCSAAIMPRREQYTTFPAMVLNVLEAAHHEGYTA